MRYLPGEEPGHQGMILTKRKRARTATSHADADEATDEVDDDEARAAALNASLANSVQAGIALEDDEDEQGKDDNEEMDRSDMEDELGEVEGTEDWVNEDSDLGPEDGEADEEEVFDDHYAPF